MCRVLGLSASGYYAWLRRKPSARARRDAQLTERIKEIWSGNYEVYGRPRIHAELREEGKRIGAKRVGRLMRAAGIAAGVSRRRSTKTTTRDQRAARVAPDLVDRDFSAAAADRLWVADITYVRTWTGFLYVAVVLDAFSRRVVGWAMAAHLRTELVLDALNMALWRRRAPGVIHHSDQGSQYTSIAFGARCKEAGVRPSTGSVGDAYDNALCESFFATLECELLDRRSFHFVPPAQGRWTATSAFVRWGSADAYRLAPHAQQPAGVVAGAAVQLDELIEHRRLLSLADAPAPVGHLSGDRLALTHGEPHLLRPPPSWVG